MLTEPNSFELVDTALFIGERLLEFKYVLKILVNHSANIGIYFQ
jgi:hypothetical protein